MNQPGPVTRLRLERAERILRSSVADGTIGVQCYVRHRNLEWHAAFGDESPGRRPVTTETTLRWLCASKVAIAATLLTLEREGKIDFDARVDHVVPGYGAGGKRGVTIRHLLEHRVRFEHDPPPNLLRLQAATSVRVGVSKLRGTLLDPGAPALYSTLAGFAIFDAVVSEVSGRTLADVFASDVATPLGLSGAFIATDDRGESERRRGASPSWARRIPDPERFELVSTDSAYGSAAEFGRLLEAINVDAVGDRLGLRGSREVARIRELAASAPQQLTFANGFLVSKPHLGRHCGHATIGADARDTSLTLSDPSNDVTICIFFTGVRHLRASAARNLALSSAIYRDLGLRGAARG